MGTHTVRKQQAKCSGFTHAGCWVSELSTAQLLRLSLPTFVTYRFATLLFWVLGSVL